MEQQLINNSKNCLHRFLKDNFNHLLYYQYFRRGSFVKQHKDGIKNVCTYCGNSYPPYMWVQHFKDYHYNDSIFFWIDDLKFVNTENEYEYYQMLVDRYNAEKWHLEYIRHHWEHRQDFRWTTWHVHYNNAISFIQYYKKKMLQADLIKNC